MTIYFYRNSKIGHELCILARVSCILLAFLALPPSLIRGESDATAARGVDKASSEALKSDVLRRWREAKASLQQSQSNVFALEEKLGEDHPDVKQARVMLDIARNNEVGLRSEYFALRGSVAEERSTDMNATAELARKQQEMEIQERRLASMAEHLRRLEQERAEAPIEGAIVQIYTLSNAKAAEAASTVESLFGPHIRVAIDDRTNQLVVSGKEKTLEALNDLLSRLDESSAPGGVKGTLAALPARTVLLRVFWLADGLPEDAGDQPDKYLPDTVVEAIKDLGLEAPQLISQSVNSLAVDPDQEVPYSNQMPAVLRNQHVSLQCSGLLRPPVDDKLPLEIALQVSGHSIACELKGSLVTPLGHYMVLGTANSLIPERSSMPGMHGGEMGIMKGGGFAPGIASMPAVDPTKGMPSGAAEEPKFHTSRFAFVVQVIEGQSYGLEE